MNLKTAKQEKIFFYSGLGLCLLLSGVLIFRGIYPGINSWFRLRKELAQKKTELKRRYNTAEENQRLAQEIAKIEKDYGEFNAMLFPPNDVSGAVKEIAKISQDLQIEFISLVPLSARVASSSPEIGFSLWEIPISIKIKTSYAKLLDFIKRIENSSKFINIDDFQITKSASNLLVHDVGLSLCVYSLEQEKAQ